MGDTTCDYPGCTLPISQRCNLCGRSMCVRHIQWIPAYTYGYIESTIMSAHYRCDICSAEQREQRYLSDQTTAEAKWVISFWLVVFGIAFPPFGVFLLIVYISRKWSQFSRQRRADAARSAAATLSTRPSPPESPPGPPLAPRSFGEAFQMRMFVRPSERQAWLARRRDLSASLPLNPLQRKLRLSLIWSLIGWIILVGPIIGIVYGFSALKEINQTGNSLPERKRAIFRIVLGFCVLAFVLVELVVGIVTAATQPTGS